MILDVLGLLAACSYALDCVEAELVHVTNNHSKRVAYMSVCIAKQMGIQEESLQDLAVCALLHDNALTQYIQEELHNDISQIAVTQEVPKLGAHCIWGEKNVAELPFHTDVSDVILYHHENADGSGPFGKNGMKFLFSRVLFICAICWISPVALKNLRKVHGRWQSSLFKTQQEQCLIGNAVMHFARIFRGAVFYHLIGKLSRISCGRWFLG